MGIVPRTAEGDMAVSNLNWLTEIEERATRAVFWALDDDAEFAEFAREDISRLCRTLRAVEKTLVEWEWYRDHTAQAARGPFHDGTCAARETCATELRRVLRGEL